MSTVRRTLLLAFALLGLGVSSTASYVHFKLITDPSYASFCDVSATVNCTAAYTSQYGSLFGVPVALGGVLFFLLVLLLAGATGGPGSPLRDTAPAYIFLLSMAGFAFTLYLGWASYVILRVFCLLCALTYVSVLAILIISRGATTVPMKSLPDRAPRDLRAVLTSPLALLVTLVLVIGVVAAVVYFPRENPAAAAAAQIVIPTLTAEERTRLEAWWDVQPKVELPVPMASGAKVQLLTFSDYQCPGCRAAHDILKPVLAKYDRGVVDFALKHYPLEAECNASVPGGTHLAACEAAAAYVMARGTGFQQKLDDWLFENQRSLTRDVVRQAAKDSAGIADFDARYAQALQEVKADAGLGAILNVRYTPTIYLNGRMIVGGGNPMPPAQAVDALIDIELKRAK